MGSALNELEVPSTLGHETVQGQSHCSGDQCSQQSSRVIGAIEVHATVVIKTATVITFYLGQAVAMHALDRI